MKNSIRIVRPVQLAEMLSVSTVTLWRMEKRGELPPRIKISKGVVGWVESEINEWIKNRPNVNQQDALEGTEK